MQMRYVSSMIIDSLFVPFSTSLTRYHSSFSSMYQANENGGNAPNVFEEVAADQAAAGLVPRVGKNFRSRAFHVYKNQNHQHTP